MREGVREMGVKDPPDSFCSLSLGLFPGGGGGAKVGLSSIDKYLSLANRKTAISEICGCLSWLEPERRQYM